MAEKQIVSMQDVESLLKPNTVNDPHLDQAYTVYELESKPDGKTYAYTYYVNYGIITPSKPEQYEWDDPILQNQLCTLMPEIKHQGITLVAIVMADIYDSACFSEEDGVVIVTRQPFHQKFGEYDMNNLKRFYNDIDTGKMVYTSDHFIKFIIRDNKTGVIKSTPNYIHILHRNFASDRERGFLHSVGILHYLGYRKKEHFLKMLAQTQKMHQK